MPTPPHPALVFLLVLFSGWVNRHQQRVVEYLVEENRVPRRKMGKRRIREPKFTDEFRSMLRDDGVKCVRTPHLSPDCNSVAERWVLTIKEVHARTGVNGGQFRGFDMISAI